MSTFFLFYDQVIEYLPLCLSTVVQWLFQALCRGSLARQLQSVCPDGLHHGSWREQLCAEDHRPVGPGYDSWSLP